MAGRKEGRKGKEAFLEPNSSTYYVCAARMLTDGSRDGRRCHSPITWEEGLDDKSFGLSLLMIGKVQTEHIVLEARFGVISKTFSGILFMP